MNRKPAADVAWPELTNQHTLGEAASSDESPRRLSERTAPRVLRCRMSNMTNDAYRKSRGTNKPFTGSEEQARTIWNELIRQEKYQYRKPNPLPEATQKG
jgi:hypothetical protein